MLTKINEVAFKLLLAVLFAGFLAGCKPPGPKALLDGKRLLERGKPAAAVDRLETATQLLGGTNAHAWNYLGIAYHQSGQASNAVIAYKRALAANPDLMEARFNLGNLWFESGRPGEAKSEFTAYTLRRPNSAVGFQKLALAEMHLREVTLAEQHIRKALELDVADPESWNALGLIQLQRGKVRDAAQSFGGALQKQRDFAPALINLAVVCQQLGDRTNALKLYRQYLQLKPQPADVGAVAAVVRQLERELAPVRAAVVAPPEPAPSTTPVAPAAPAPQVAAKPEVTTPPPVQRPPSPVPVSVPAPEPVSPAPQPKPPVAEVQTVKRTPVAVRVPVEPEIKIAPVVDAAAPVAKASATPARTTPSPAEPRPELVSASAEEKRGFTQKVNLANRFRGNSKRPTVTPLPNAEFPDATEPDITSASVPVSNGARYQYKGAGNVASGDRAEAQRLAAAGIKAMQARRYVDAATAFRSAAKADPSWFQVHFNLAVAAMEAGYNSEALAASETALALEPGSAEARYNFALALKRGGYFTDAAIELEKALRAHPDDVRGHLALGNLYAEQLRQKDKARAHYQKLLELDPRHPRAGAIHFWLAANPGR